MNDPVALTIRKCSAIVEVPLDEDGWPLHHGERMVETEPGHFMDRTEHDVMVFLGLADPTRPPGDDGSTGGPDHGDNPQDGTP